MNIEAFHAELSKRVAGERPNVGLALVRALALFALAFTFLSGVVFTVGPMVLMAGDHLHRHIVVPLMTWLAYDPVTGFWLTALFHACTAMSVAYLLRHYLLLAATYLASRAAKLAKAAGGIGKPAGPKRTDATRTSPRSTTETAPMVRLFAMTVLFTMIAGGAVAAAPADPNTVTIPYGEVLASAVLALGGIVSWAIGRAVGFLPGPARWIAEVTKLDQVAQRSIETAAFDLAERIKKEGYTVNVRNEMLASAVKVFAANAASLYRQYEGTVVAKIKARIEAYIAERAAT